MTPDAFTALSAPERERLSRTDQLSWVDPMLATLTDRRFSDTGWIFERKLDGIRCLAYRSGDAVSLFSRKRQRLERTYPEIAENLAAQREDNFVIDGEIVAFEGRRTSFALLQQRSGIIDPTRARQSTVRVIYYAFDILHLDGYDTRGLSLRARKRVLRSAIEFTGPLRFTVHRNTDGEGYFESACSRGWEGIIAKKADSLYSSRRSPNWLKFKCSVGQEFVIGGFTQPAGSRTGFGALLLGHYEGERFVYAGKVGTGFDERTLRDLRAKLGQLEIEQSPFAGFRRFERGTHFVQPLLVCQVTFTEWTRDGMLRHPRFEGIREDKAASEVVREATTSSRS